MGAVLAGLCFDTVDVITVFGLTLAPAADLTFSMISSLSVMIPVAMSILGFADKINCAPALELEVC